ncbi:hypothetical protein INR49_013759 [Caranx melampygus]|nr:hypothetical protein INR49_013759 [Caranx melampygus]
MTPIIKAAPTRTTASTEKLVMAASFHTSAWKLVTAAIISPQSAQKAFEAMMCAGEKLLAVGYTIPETWNFLCVRYMDLISVRVNLHLLLFLQLPPQSGQVLLDGIMGEEESVELQPVGILPQELHMLLLSLSRAVRFSATETWISFSLACVCSSCTFSSRTRILNSSTWIIQADHSLIVHGKKKCDKRMNERQETKEPTSALDLRSAAMSCTLSLCSFGADLYMSNKSFISFWDSWAFLMSLTFLPPLLLLLLVLILLFLYIDAITRRLLENQNSRVTTLTTQLSVLLKLDAQHLILFAHLGQGILQLDDISPQFLLKGQLITLNR